MRKVDSGYEGQNVPEDYSIPSFGIEDMDRAVFQLFDKTLSFEVSVNNVTSHVPVVFSTGERFALTRRKQPIRDKNNALILPIISIKRGAIDYSPGQNGYGTPIAFGAQSFYAIKRRLSKTDRKYQNLINKQGLRNQDDVSSRNHFLDNTVSPGNDTAAGTVATRRNGKNLSYMNTGGIDPLRPNIGNNIFEIITIPYPNFIEIDYEITIWTQYTKQMNEILESIVARFDGNMNQFEMVTDKGYKLVAFFKPPFTAQDNFSDFSTEERVIKSSFTVSVPGYILAPRHPGLQADPFRSFFSAPTIEFGIKESNSQVVVREKSPDGNGNINDFILTDTEILNIDGTQPLRRGESSADIVETIKNPFTGKETFKFSKVRLRNERAGETVASSRIVVDLETQSD